MLTHYRVSSFIGQCYNLIMKQEQWARLIRPVEEIKKKDPKEELALRFELAEKSSWEEIWKEADKVTFLVYEAVRKMQAVKYGLPEDTEWDEIWIARKLAPPEPEPEERETKGFVIKLDQKIKIN